MIANGPVVLFAGPTLKRAHEIEPELALDGIDVVPPVKRGDVPEVVANASEPGVLAIADGLFHGALAVGHQEVRAALAAGWQVWGLSSMGAIRAREMHHLGMRGYGAVFAMFCRPGVDFRDDEVALLHEHDPPYRELSEPLVHLRLALDHCVADGALTAAQRDAAIEELASWWFGDRSLGAFRELLTGALAADALERVLGDFNRFRVKAHDLIGFVRERPWQTAA